MDNESFQNSFAKDKWEDFKLQKSIYGLKQASQRLEPCVHKKASGSAMVLYAQLQERILAHMT